MIKFKLDNQTYSMPQCWEDISYKQFMELKSWDGEDRLMFLSILTRVPIDIMEQTSVLDLDDRLEPYASFINKEFKVKDDKQINFRGQNYKIPKELAGKYSLSQKISLKDKVVQCTINKQELYDIIPFAVAVYLYPLVSGKKYETEYTEELIPEILECSFLEVFSIGSFFLKRLQGYQSANKKRFHVRTLVRNAWQGLKFWNNSKNSQRLITLQEGIF